MSFRAFVALLCGCFILLAAGTNTVNAQHFTCQFDKKAKICGGTCPQGQACTIKAGSDICSCQVAANTCKYDAAKKTCGGKCPVGQTCTIKPGSDICGCTPVSDTCKYDAKKKTCGGTCPGGKKCIGGKDKCHCD